MPAPLCRGHVDTGKELAILLGYEADWRYEGWRDWDAREVGENEWVMKENGQ